MEGIKGAYTLKSGNETLMSTTNYDIKFPSVNIAYGQIVPPFYIDIQVLQSEKTEGLSTILSRHYTKYCIYCHMIFYVTSIAFLVTLVVYKFIVIPTCFQFIQMPIIETKFGIICILTNMGLNIVMKD